MNKIRLSIILFTLFILIVSVVLFIVNQPIKTGMRFISTPDNLQVKGGEYNFTASYGNSFSVKPGNYTFIVTKDGFSSNSIDVAITENTISQICVSLEPQTDAARKELSDTKDISSRQEAVGGCQVDVGAKSIETEYPFVNKLPIIDKYFNASSCMDGDGKTIICVTLLINSDVQKQRALAAIKSKGINTDTIKVRFLESGND